MPSLPQNRGSKVVLFVENSQFDVMDWFPLPQGSQMYFLVFFCLPWWHPDSLYFTLHKCCLSGHSGVLEVVSMIVQPSVLAKLLQHTSTHFALLMINLAGGGNDHPNFSLCFIFNFLRPHQTLREILSTESYHTNMWKLIQNSVVTYISTRSRYIGILKSNIQLSTLINDTVKCAKHLISLTSCLLGLSHWAGL